MLANEQLLDQMIVSQQRAIRYYLLFAGGLIAVGLLIVILVYTLAGSLLPDVFKHLAGLGGGFISSLSALQIKEILVRKEKAEMFTTLKSRLAQFNQGQMSDEELNRRIDELIWKIVEKTALG